MKWKVPVTLRWERYHEITVEASSLKQARKFIEAAADELEWDWEGADFEQDIHWSSLEEDAP